MGYCQRKPYMTTDQEAKTTVDEAHTLHKDQEEKQELIRNPLGQRKRG